MTEKERYIELCAQEPSICVYDQPWWMDAVCGEENWDVLLYEKNGVILGALPYYMKKKYGLKYITQPRFTQHNGVWINYPPYQAEAKRLSMEKEVITALIERVETLPVCAYQQRYAPTLTNWQPLYWKGYKQSTNYTYRIDDISDPDSIFLNFQPNKRRTIRKAQKNNYQIKFDLPADEFYALHKQSLAKQGADISYSYDLFERIYQAAYAHQSGRTIYLTTERGDVLCALFDIWDARWGYNLINAIDPDTRNSGAADLLLFSMITYLSGKVSGFDFEGSMIEQNEESIRRFGGKQTPYFSIRKVYTKNPLLRAVIQKKLG